MARKKKPRFREWWGPKSKRCDPEESFIVSSYVDSYDAPSFQNAVKEARETCRGTRVHSQAAGDEPFPAAVSCVADTEAGDRKVLYMCEPFANKAKDIGGTVAKSFRRDLNKVTRGRKLQTKTLRGLSGNRCRRKDGRFKACKRRKKR